MTLPNLLSTTDKIYSIVFTSTKITQKEIHIESLYFMFMILFAKSNIIYSNFTYSPQNLIISIRHM